MYHISGLLLAMQHMLRGLRMLWQLNRGWQGLLLLLLDLSGSRRLNTQIMLLMHCVLLLMKLRFYCGRLLH